MIEVQTHNDGGNIDVNGTCLQGYVHGPGQQLGRSARLSDLVAVAQVVFEGSAFREFKDHAKVP